MNSTQIQMIPLSCSQLSSKLERGCSSRLLLIDTRPNPQHCKKHIKHSENINFSSILLRRLMKGVVQLKTLVPCQELVQKLTSWDSTVERLVLYDSCSDRNSIKSDLIKHAEVLAGTEYRKSSDSTVYFLDGGFDAMSLDYPHLCAQFTIAENKPARSPLGISVSASLPILSLPGPGRRKTLQTPSEDCGNQFGPPMEILPHLVLGCAKDSSNLTLLRKRGVTAILNVSHNCPNHFESLLEYKCIPVQDSYQADLLSKMEMAIDYINSIKAKNGCVFVHCHAGISRSATICIAYIMKTMKCDLTNAYEFVKEKRPCVSPNLHFMGQLLAYQKQLEESSEDMEEIQSSCIDTGNTSSSICSGTDGLHSDMSIHNMLTSPVIEEEDECDSVHCLSGSPLPSASAPSSLNFDCNPSPLQRETEPMDISQTPQVLTERTVVNKPTSLPLLQQPQTFKSSTTDGIIHGFLRENRQPLNNSTSLPTTPLSQYRNPLCSAASTERKIIPLQHSPCRMFALLGSRSVESCLNYVPLTEKSM